MTILKFLGIRGMIGLAVAIILTGLLVAEKVDHADTRRDLVAAEQALTAEQNAHRQTELNYRRASDEARRIQAENIARVKAEQQAVNERSEREYEARIADARARAERLRYELEAGSRANPGGSRNPRVSDRPGSPGELDEATPDYRLSVTERLIATEQAIQLNGLQKWVRETLSIPVNVNSSSSPNGSR